jgi:CheY-specific phosphatase CheX
LELFDSMLSMEVERLTQVPESALEGAKIVGTVSFAGDVDGIFNIHVRDDFAIIMSAAMLDVEPGEVGREEEVHDVIHEISNMIGGNLKSKFADAGLACALSAVYYERDGFKKRALYLCHTRALLLPMPGTHLCCRSRCQKRRRRRCHGRNICGSKGYTAAR